MPTVAITCLACGGPLARSVSPAKGYWRLCCRACGLSRIDPLPDADALADYYSRVYSLAIDADRVEIAAYERQAEEMARIFARLAPEAKTICEVGCSAGWALAALQRRGYRVSGYELSATTSRIARERFGLDVATGEFTAEGVLFDIVVMRHVLEHTLDPAAQLAAAAARLSPGGLLFLVVPNGGGLSSRLLGQYWSWYIPPAHIWYFTAASLTKLVDASGLTVRESGTRQGDADTPPIEIAVGAARWARRRLPGRAATGTGTGAVRERLRTEGPVHAMMTAANAVFTPVSAGVTVLGLGDELWLGAAKR